MKVLFVDIDGVLNCKKTPNPRKLPYVADPHLVERFKRTVETLQANVVLSSTWRYDPVGLFAAKYWGVPFDDILPDMPGRPRRDEILSWLKQHPETTRFAVLDDEDDELDALPLFQPSREDGLTEEICGTLIRYMAGQTDHDMRRSRVIRIFQNFWALLTFHRG